MNPQVVNGMVALLWIGAMIYFVYRFLKFKAVIYNDDGTFIEMPLSSKVTRIDTGDCIYIVKPAAIVKKMILGILPQARIFFMKNCPEPISFHSGKAIYNPIDLKLPVFGVFQCPDCKKTAMKIVKRVGGQELRDITEETRTKRLGMPEARKFEMKWLIYIVAIGVAAAFIYLALTGMAGGGTGPVTPENVVV